MLLLMTVSSAGIYSYSRRIVGGEFLSLHEVSADDLAAAAGYRVEQIEAFARKLAGNSRILELARKVSPEDRKKKTSWWMRCLNSMPPIWTARPWWRLTSSRATAWRCPVIIPADSPGNL